MNFFQKKLKNKKETKKETEKETRTFLDQSQKQKTILKIPNKFET